MTMENPPFEDVFPIENGWIFQISPTVFFIPNLRLLAPLGPFSRGPRWMMGVLLVVEEVSLMSINAQ